MEVQPGDSGFSWTFSLTIAKNAQMARAIGGLPLGEGWGEGVAVTRKENSPLSFFLSAANKKGERSIFVFVAIALTQPS